ncbi:MAG: type II toxin-antitoxin system VapC family toxin [Candidatus Geothermarchaeales archaeon]
MYLIDTNIFLEVMLSRPRKDVCKRFLGLLRDGEERGVVTEFSVYSIMVIMGSFKKREQLKTFLSSLSAYDGLGIHVSTLSDKLKAVDVSLDKRLDVDDSIQYSIAQAIDADGIVSFDKHFDGLEIPRVEPQSFFQLH